MAGVCRIYCRLSKSSELRGARIRTFQSPTKERASSSVISLTRKSLKSSQAPPDEEDAASGPDKTISFPVAIAIQRPTPDERDQVRWTAFSPDLDNERLHRDNRQLVQSNGLPRDTHLQLILDPFKGRPFR